MRRVALVGLLALLLLRPSVASAESLTFDWATSLGSGSWVGINMGDGRGFVTGWSGEINWTTSSGQLFKAYCADLFDDATIPTQMGSFGSSSDLDNGTFTSLHAGANAGADAAYLVNTNASGAQGNNDLAAGLQIAVWEAMFGGQLVYNASTSVWANSLWQLQQSASSTIMAAANTYYGGLMSADQTVVLGSSAKYFDTVNSQTTSGASANGQDQIGVPEPMTILLMLFAMAGMLTYQSRLKRRRVEA